ncbi:MAG: NAD(P)H-dependent oxidoreductase subunit E [Desulfofustis sp.]|nr:NAD(P)H-dependent oxidoreductase subunit E [Desulfofustis sp.]
METLLPIGIITAILFALTVILLIADKLLVSYGDCTVSVDDEEGHREFTVQGGSTLLSVLIDQGMEIPASCGGRGSCGFCKLNVKSGGGDILPTEEMFISKEEKKTGTRLACQVKVKDNIELFVPDLINTVKGMAETDSFDTRTKWTFTREGAMQVIEDKKKPKLDRQSRDKLIDIIDRHRDDPGAVMPILHEINATFNYLPEAALRTVSKEMGVPLSTIYRIATFYNLFSLTPVGKYKITICTGTACHVKGADGLLEAFEPELGIKSGETTADGLFTIEEVRCIGCCGLAPVLTVNEEVHGLMTKKKVPELIEQYKAA